MSAYIHQYKLMHCATRSATPRHDTAIPTVQLCCAAQHAISTSSQLSLQTRKKTNKKIHRPTQTIT